MVPWQDTFEKTKLVLAYCLRVCILYMLIPLLFGRTKQEDSDDNQSEKREKEKTR